MASPPYHLSRHSYTHLFNDPLSGTTQVSSRLMASPPYHLSRHSYTHLFNDPLSRQASTRKVKPIWISLKQETVSGSSISWTIYTSAPRYRHQIRSEVMINWLQSVKSVLTGEKRSTVRRICEKARFTPGIKE